MDPHDLELARIGTQLGLFTDLVQKMVDDTLDLVNTLGDLPELPAEDETAKSEATAHLYELLTALAPLFGELRLVKERLEEAEHFRAA